MSEERITGSQAAMLYGRLQRQRQTGATVQHTVQTRHIQRLIINALDLAQRVDGLHQSQDVAVQPAQRFDEQGEVNVFMALRKAAADLRHAAEELEAEAQSCLGWRQV